MNKQKYLLTKRFEFEAADDAQARHLALCLLNGDSKLAEVKLLASRKEETKLQRLVSSSPPVKVELR